MLVYFIWFLGEASVNLGKEKKYTNIAMLWVLSPLLNYS